MPLPKNHSPTYQTTSPYCELKKFHELEWLDVSLLGMMPLFAFSGVIWSMLSTEWGLLDHDIFVYKYTCICIDI